MMQARPLARILRQNLKRNLRHLVLSGFGIAVGIAAFVFFWGLSEGVSNVVLHDIFPIDRVEVISPKTSFTGVQKRIDDELVSKVRARPEVRAAYPKLKMAFPARGEGELLGSQVRFEVAGFCDGVDPVLVQNDPGGSRFKDWEAVDAGKPPTACAAIGDCPQDHYCSVRGACRHRVPVLISRTVIEIYNGSFAESHGLPRIGAAQEAVLQQQMNSLWFTMALGESYVQGSTGGLRAPPERVQAQLVGISDKAMPVGMTIPIGYLKRWNERYVGPDAARSYSSIVVDLKDRKMLSDFIAWVKSQGYTDEFSAAERIALVITIVTALFVLIAFTIMFISAVNISHTFFMMISERRREIGLMRALGASRGDIWKIVLGEAAVIGVVAGTVGIAASIGVAKFIDYVSRTRLPPYPFKPETYFSFSPILILAALAFAALFCVVGASLPARRAARIHPAQALSG